MTTYFLSDCHLQAEKPDTAESFIRFWRGPARDASSIYVLGDLFNVWMGDDIQCEFTQLILKEIKTVASTVPCYFMPGNRDFLVGKQFAHDSGLALLGDYYVLTLNQRKYLLTHGDLLCSDDKPYQRYRKIVRHQWFQKLFLCLPQKKRIQIAHNMRQKSIAHQKKACKNTLQANSQTTQAICQRFGVEHIIYGHVHTPKIVQNGSVTEYILGDWHANGGMILKIDQEPELFHFN